MKVGRGIRWLIGITMATGALFAIAVALRVPLAERAAGAYLAAQGFPEASVSVSRIGPDHAVIDNLALGPGLPAIERIEISYRMAELAGLRLRAVRIEGLRAVVDGRDPEALARLKRFLPSGGGRDDDGMAAPGPTVDLADAQIVFRTARIGEVTLTFRGSLDLAGSPVRASFEGRADGEFGQAAVTAWATPLVEHPTIQIQGYASADLARLPWPEGLEPRPRGGTLQLSLSGNLPVPSLEGPVVAGLLASDGSLVVDLKVRGAALPPYAASVDAGASFTARTGGGVLVLSMEEPAALTVRGLPPEMPRTVAEADFTLEAAQPAGPGADPSRATATISGRLTENRVDATLLAEGIWAPGGPIAGQLRLRDGSFRMPGRDILAASIEAAMPFPFESGGEPAHLSATVSTVSGRLAPLNLNARITREDETLRLEGSLASPDGGVRIPLQARCLGTEARGNVALGPATLQFQPDALQPAALGSAFAMVTQAEGAIEMSGTLAFAPAAPLQGSAAVGFHDVTLETAEGVIEKLNGTIRLDGLFPPRTAGPQAISAGRIVSGVPLEQPSLSFRLEPTEAGTAVVIDRAEGRIAEGTVVVEGARFDPAQSTHAFQIAIRDLSLDRLLGDYAMEGMSGTGTLAGIIPVTFSAAGVAIESGIVRAQGGGILKVDWGSSRDAMAKQGESVALMVQTLEDFHYSTLLATIERPADGSLSLKVALEGHNPAVKNGHPFRFNISFSGDLEKILAAVREGRRLGSNLFRGSLGETP
ncbi:intermembrane phospholipid transport protein YdbH family protein [Shumkonia mesophila]|uniref:intermembrane phospholipid transport protein YdbH family protein n=1 Tax=Shumkonia mesophila TaxID=2838854 RepID=UPI002934AB05|nr:YdbH domain-containing protein [Shumkonia mesophila]